MQKEQKNWNMEQASCYPGHKEKKYKDKYAKEVTNVLVNLATYIATLNNGVNPEQAKRTLPFVHEEKNGLIAIDQRPPVKGVQLRLYLFTDVESETIFVIVIGDKNTQKADIQLGHQFIKDFKNGKARN